jgi:hypothetical protein
MKRKTIVLNLLAGPGNLKSGIASGVFSLLKLHMVNCELITEYAKDLTWEDRFNTLEDQLYVFAKQNRKLKRVIGKVDVAVTDTSLLLSNIYNSELMEEHFKKSVLNTYNSYNNLNIKLTRNNDVTYEEVGRKEDLTQSKSIDNDINSMLHLNNIDYIELTPNYEAINYIARLILSELGKKMKISIKG